jgi:hypothetical protein
VLFLNNQSRSSSAVSEIEKTPQRMHSTNTLDASRRIPFGSSEAQIGHLSIHDLSNIKLAVEPFLDR